MIFIGDVHAKVGKYKDLLSKAGDSHSVQVGDLGVGFVQQSRFDDIPPQHRFIRGNHDHPDKCRQMLTMIPDNSYQWIDGACHYFLGGAYSIDRHMRTVGVDWWDDEELSYLELSEAMHDYEKISPEVVVTHDGPSEITKHMFSPVDIIKNRTGQALSSMFEIHQPRLWIFGHWHDFRKMKVLGTEFICLGELDTIET